MAKQFDTIWRVALASLLVIAEVIAVQTIYEYWGGGFCQFNYPPYFIVRCSFVGYTILAVCLLGSIALVQMFTKGWHEFYGWAKTPTSKNIGLGSNGTDFNQNIHDLLVLNNEWREKKIVLRRQEIVWGAKVLLTHQGTSDVSQFGDHTIQFIKIFKNKPGFSVGDKEFTENNVNRFRVTIQFVFPKHKTEHKKSFDVTVIYQYPSYFNVQVSCIQNATT